MGFWCRRGERNSCSELRCGGIANENRDRLLGQFNGKGRVLTDGPVVSWGVGPCPWANNLGLSALVKQPMGFPGTDDIASARGILLNYQSDFIPSPNTSHLYLPTPKSSC